MEKGKDVDCGGGEGRGFLCRRDDERVLVEGGSGDGDGALAAGVRSAASSVVENASSRYCCSSRNVSHAYETWIV